VKNKEMLRIIDANLNRLREALRVSEDIVRFSAEDRPATSKLKRIRHSVHETVSGSKALAYPSLINSRDSAGDIGKQSIGSELKRRGAIDLLGANMQRAKESARVLEECSKAIDKNASAAFKRIRFSIYDTEKVLIEKLGSTGNTRPRTRRR